MTSIWRFASVHVCADWRRTLSAGFSIMVAVFSFVVLTGSVSTERLTVTNTVANNYRSTYDVLVRPHGAASELEQTRGAVRPNYLTETYGGITLSQVAQIAGLPDVEVAAPVAVLGMFTANVMLRLRVDHVLGARDHAMVRFSVGGAARRGSAITTSGAGYLYLTRNPLTTVEEPGASTGSSPRVIEQGSDGPVTVCLGSAASGLAVDPTKTFSATCWSASTSPDGVALVEALLTIPLSIQAVDPRAEEKLTGLSRAVSAGRSLSEQDSAGESSTAGGTLDSVVAVMASDLPLDYQAELRVEELDERTLTEVLSTEDSALRSSIVTEAVPRSVVGSVRQDAAQAYRDQIVGDAIGRDGASQSLIALALIQPGQVSYGGGETLTPRVVACDPRVWLSTPASYMPTPSTVCDTGYRAVTMHAGTTSGNLLSFSVVGTFDRQRADPGGGTNEVPLETYRSSTVVGADDASRGVLKDQPLLPDLNPSGYVQSPPAILVSLAALPMLAKHFPGMDYFAPVSSVRVRVAKVSGLGNEDRERIRAVAEGIHRSTGLDVDITAGASLQSQVVSLSATASGTPALLVTELWTKKGVAIAISDALDRKSLVLLALILATSTLTVWLTSMAIVRTRRRQLGTLACLGWTPGQRQRELLAELMLVGTVAGIIGTGAAVPTVLGTGVRVPWLAWALAVPLGVLLTLGPALWAALAASRVSPADAFREAPPNRFSRSLVHVRGPFTAGAALLLLRPGRLVVGASGVALAVIANVLVLAVATHFRTTLIGTLLGDAVAVEVRGTDIVAASLIALLGFTALATLVALQISENLPSYAALRAMGWAGARVRGVVFAQSMIVAAVGTVAGAGLALLAWRVVFKALDGAVYGATGLVAGSAVLAALAVTIWPARSIMRADLVRVLSAE